MKCWLNHNPKISLEWSARKSAIPSSPSITETAVARSNHGPPLASPVVDALAVPAELCALDDGLVEAVGSPSVFGAPKAAPAMPPMCPRFLELSRTATILATYLEPSSA